MSNLGVEYPKMQAHCREVLAQYREIGPTGIFGAMMIENLLRRADAAVVEGDVVAMLRIYQEMQDVK